jgi:hypothetical protein
MRHLYSVYKKQWSIWKSIYTVFLSRITNVPGGCYVKESIDLRVCCASQRQFHIVNKHKYHIHIEQGVLPLLFPYAVRKK